MTSSCNVSAFSIFAITLAFEPAPASSLLVSRTSSAFNGKEIIYRGVYPCSIEKNSADDWNDVNSKVIENLINKSVVDDKDIVIVTKGMHKDKSGGTNLMKILRVGDGNY